MKCSECESKTFTKGNGSPNRYYCVHPTAMEGIGARLICRCERGSDELTIKTSPKWCPLKELGGVSNVRKASISKTL